MNDCLFCGEEFRKNIICENKYWFAVYDQYPVSKGHVLIIPKRHISSIFHIHIEWIWLLPFIKQIRRIVVDKFQPDSFNIGINDGLEAGQTIPHLHIHLIPRYKNDEGLPCGVRNIFPSNLADYTKVINN